MGETILPNGNVISTTPNEIVRYLSSDGLRQLLRQERLRWNLKVNKDIDYYDKTRLSKHTGEIHNDGMYQKVQLKTFPDNGAFPGYTGLYNDSGIQAIKEYDVDKWDDALSDESKRTLVNRTIIGSIAKIRDKIGYGLGDNKKMNRKTDNRSAMILFDPYDGRSYLLSNDSPNYVNNENRRADEKIPGRSIARICDIPTKITHLYNDLNYIADPDYNHTDNNFTNSHRYVLDNLDDRTFVYPEISRDKNGNDFVENMRIGLNGEPDYFTSDGTRNEMDQPDLGENPDLGKYGDRFGEAINSYNKNVNYSGVTHRRGYLPGIFRSVEELERVDLVDQMITPRTHKDTPGAKRYANYYLLDGVWSPNWYDRENYRESYLAQSLNPISMESYVLSNEPKSFMALNKHNNINHNLPLYQWRYNRITVKYPSDKVKCFIKDPGEDYKVGDILSWTFTEDSFEYEVTLVGSNGEILKGDFRVVQGKMYDQDPSTHNVGVSFKNTSGLGRNAKISITSEPVFTSHATQIKNNLYAYVDIVPTVRSNNSTSWSDTNARDSQEGKVTIRSTAAGPGFTGINSGKGGPMRKDLDYTTEFYEHGGNATAGVQVHLFRYVLDTENPKWVIRNGIQVFLGRWVDQGPMGLERPCDIKALYLSNYDTNNFNNYYKFTLDNLFDNHNENPDTIITNNKNSFTNACIHFDQEDPSDDQVFMDTIIDPKTSMITKVDITHKILYINSASGDMFVYNQTYKHNPNTGTRSPGWMKLNKK